jgi:hypothetical protein
MRTELEKENKNNENFIECALAIKKKNMENLIQQLQKICFFSSWEISVSEYEELFDEIIDNQRKLSLEEKKTDIIVFIC